MLLEVAHQELVDDLRQVHLPERGVEAARRPGGVVEPGEELAQGGDVRGRPVPQPALVGAPVALDGGEPAGVALGPPEGRRRLAAALDDQARPRRASTG